MVENAHNQPSELWGASPGKPPPAIEIPSCSAVIALPTHWRSDGRTLPLLIFVEFDLRKQEEAIDARIAQIRREAEAADTDFDKEKATERIAALGGGIARIKVGAATETELKDKKLRYEDALNSVDSARELGIVPGGGACLAALQISMVDKILDAMDSEDEKIGAGILIKALSAPCMQVATNAGIEGAVVLSKVQAAAAEHGVSSLMLYYHCRLDKI